MAYLRNWGLIDPARNAELIDVAAADHSCTHTTTAVYVGTSGDIKVDMVGTGTAVVFSNVPTGTVLPIQISKVYTSGTTASTIIVLW